jgi:uncharacterized membrane protein (UPF0182 family)
MIHNLPQRKDRTKWIVRLLPIALLLLVIIAFSDWIMQWMWLSELDYSEVFWTMKKAQISLFILAFLLTGLYVGLNMRKLVQLFPRFQVAGTPLEQTPLDPSRGTTQKVLRRIGYLITLMLSIFFAFAYFNQWDALFRYTSDVSVGTSDPIFGLDIGFYLFQLPFLELLQNSLSILFGMGLIVLVLIYLNGGLLGVSNKRSFFADPQVRKQLSINLTLWILSIAFGFWLDRYDLLLGDSGVVYGVSFTDDMVRIPALSTLSLVLFILAALSIWNYFSSKTRLLIWGAGTSLVIYVLGMVVIPQVIQSFNVNPNELQLETPYIEKNINLTRQAYGLDAIKDTTYNAGDSLSYGAIQRNQQTINSIRLWDPRLIIQTYRQLQEIRLYYQFYNVDIDRYRTENGYQQMMLSARELDSKLPEQADTWVNRNLQYTHGYGLTMSPVARINQGEPEFLIKDLPPVSREGLNVDQAAIYYGEQQKGYKIVNTGVQELDYPKGDENVYTNYQGEGGIPISSFWRQLLFSWRLGDFNLLLSDYINDDSRLQIWQNVQERVRRVTPFLQLDDDPYLVLANGKLYWMQDAYTTSSYFPYSEPFQSSVNYIRNSVKIVVDAYDGSVDFYVMDQQDPVLKVYRNLFPTVFKPYEQMPDQLKSHIRYPQNLFTIQMDLYRKYHMTDPQVFYNSEDLWTRPSENYGGRAIPMEPYYLLSKLPGEDRLEYLLISPLTPSNRDNMIAWMAAKSDPPHYGEIVVYKLPKERLILGPSQIEAKIEQDTDISRQLSLWDQRGSSVIRGNLMVVPIDTAFLYVEPVFLIAEGVDIPQLQRVIATDGKRISMQPTLNSTLTALFKDRIPLVADTTRAIPLPEQASVQRELTSTQLQQARRIWRDLQDALQNNNWSEAGRLMEELNNALEQ